MQNIHLSGEQEADTSLDVLTEAGTGAFKLTRTHPIKFIKRFLPGKTDSEINSTLSDACSMYRGGVYDLRREAEYTELLDGLVGSKAAHGKPFEFVGNNSDLSYFWAKDINGKSVPLSKDSIEAISSEPLRQKVTATMNLCYTEGLLNYDAKTGNYTLTEKGEKLIYKPEFIQSRLCKEAGVSTSIDKETEALERMTARGFEGCKYATVDIKSLGATVTEDGLKAYVPGTSRKWKATFPEGTYFSLSDKTYEVYIKPDAEYFVDGAPTPVKGDELAKHFEIKKIVPDMKAPASDPLATKLEGLRAETAEFENGAYVYAVNPYSESLEVSQYRVSYSVANKESGEVFYGLKSTDLKAPDLQLPEKANGKLLFASRPEATAKLSTESGKLVAKELKNEIAKNVLEGGVKKGAEAVKKGAEAVTKAATTAVPVANIATAAADAVKTAATTGIKVLKGLAK